MSQGVTVAITNGSSGTGEAAIGLLSEAGTHSEFINLVTPGNAMEELIHP